jgi:chemotaxis protein CheX
MLDLVGEVANTFAGNARRHFGEKFNISVPSSLNGAQGKAFDGDSRPYVIPIQWRAYNSALVVCVAGPTT